MTKTKHTPGPWVVFIDEPELNDGYVSVESLDGKRISGTPAYRSDRDEKLANAQLIVAAPELLEALKAAVDCGMAPSSSSRTGGASRHSRQCVVADMIRDAITKAEGEE